MGVNEYGWLYFRAELLGGLLATQCTLSHQSANLCQGFWGTWQHGSGDSNAV